MTKIMDRVVHDVQELSSEEKNTLLKLLISSMDNKHDIDSDDQWASLAQQRINEIKSGKIQTVSWNQIKQKVVS